MLLILAAELCLQSLSPTKEKYIHADIKGLFLIPLKTSWINPSLNCYTLMPKSCRLLVDYPELQLSVSKAMFMLGDVSVRTYSTSPKK